MAGQMKLVRKIYQVPAKRGGRVRYTGERKPQEGRIVSARDGRLKIAMGKAGRRGWYHPTWEIEYLD